MMLTNHGLIRHHVWTVTGLLALWMVLTRPMPLGDRLGLAMVCTGGSMAVFFLGGFYARRHTAFVALLLLSTALDALTTYFTPYHDFTLAYAFMPLAYAVLWYGGRGCARGARSSIATFVAAMLGAALSFAISNGSYYWLSGRVADPQFGGWAASFAQWAPLFIGMTAAYVGAVLLGHAVWVSVRGAHPVRGAA